MLVQGSNIARSTWSSRFYSIKPIDSNIAHASASIDWRGPSTECGILSKKLGLNRGSNLQSRDFECPGSFVSQLECQNSSSCLTQAWSPWGRQKHAPTSKRYRSTRNFHKLKGMLEYSQAPFLLRMSSSIRCLGPDMHRNLEDGFILPPFPLTLQDSMSHYTFWLSFRHLNLPVLDPEGSSCYEGTIWTWSSKGSMVEVISLFNSPLEKRVQLEKARRALRSNAIELILWAWRRRNAQ